MELYTLNDKFVRQEVVDGFDSAIWNERYYDAGDALITLPPSKTNIALLPEGTFLAKEGTKEVMYLETATIEGGKLQCKGYSLTKFLNNRVFRVGVSSPELQKDKSYTVTSLGPGDLISWIVYQAAILGATVSVGTDGNEGIPFLTAGASDATGPVVSVAVEFGPVFDLIKTIANTYGVGFQMYLDTADVSGYSLKFKTYRGVDKSATVKFTPNMDTLQNLSELRSIEAFKNVCYAYATTFDTDLTMSSVGRAYADVASSSAVGFKRRTMHLLVDDLGPDLIPLGALAIAAVLSQRAKDALANNNYVKVVDGEVVPQSGYVYGTDFGMGDIVELASPSGLATKARVIEYIHAKDDTGERRYPTITVLD